MKINSFQEYEEAYKKSVESPEDFWGEIAANNFEWKKPWRKVLNWNFSEPKIEWFVGGNSTLLKTVSIVM